MQPWRDHRESKRDRRPRGKTPVPSRRHRTSGGQHQMAALAHRFAHGDIDEDEYKRRLAVLRGSR